jgi:hypothetical protein
MYQVITAHVAYTRVTLSVTGFRAKEMQLMAVAPFDKTPAEIFKAAHAARTLGIEFAGSVEVLETMVNRMNSLRIEEWGHIKRLSEWRISI